MYISNSNHYTAHFIGELFNMDKTYCAEIYKNEMFSIGSLVGQVLCTVHRTVSLDVFSVVFSPFTLLSYAQKGTS